MDRFLSPEEPRQTSVGVRTHMLVYTQTVRVMYVPDFKNTDGVTI